MYAVTEPGVFAAALVFVFAPTTAFAARSARATLAAVDSFGNQPAGCSVEYFPNDYDISGKENPDPRDFSEQFSSLIGRKIPDDRYSVIVRCSENYRGSLQMPWRLLHGIAAATNNLRGRGRYIKIKCG